ncbi:hypothetical protein LEMLEM_LOCUS19438 [Lemmus lemmus]
MAMNSTTIVSPPTVTLTGAPLTFTSKEGGVTVQHWILQCVSSLSNSEKSLLVNAPRKATF